MAVSGVMGMWELRGPVINAASVCVCASGFGQQQLQRVSVIARAGCRSQSHPAFRPACRACRARSTELSMQCVSPCEQSRSAGRHRAGFCVQR